MHSERQLHQNVSEEIERHEGTGRKLQESVSGGIGIRKSTREEDHSAVRGSTENLVISLEYLEGLINDLQHHSQRILQNIGNMQNNVK